MFVFCFLHGCQPSRVRCAALVAMQESKRRLGATVQDIVFCVAERRGREFERISFDPWKKIIRLFFLFSLLYWCWLGTFYDPCFFVPVGKKMPRQASC